MNQPTTVTEVKIAFGKGPDGRMVGIDEVVRGKECNCTCPECNHPLIAVQGDIVRHHFRHDSEVLTTRICNVTPESAIHKLAKQIICETAGRARARLPDELGSMISAVPEHWLDGIRPDVYAVFETEPVAIEIRVAHKVDDAKAAIYNERRLAAVEIDLSDYRDDDNLTAERIKALVLYLAPREWLSPPQYIRHKREAEIEAAKQLAEQRERERLLEIENRRIAAKLAEIQRQEAMELNARIWRAKQEQQARQQWQEQQDEERRQREEEQKRRRNAEKREIADALESERQASHADRWGTHRLMAEGKQVGH